MKRFLTNFLAIGGVALLMLASCKKDGVKVVSNGGKPGALTANATTLVLDKSKLPDTSKVISFSFNKADYGYTGAAVTNTLQIDAANDNWANPTTFSMGTKTFSQGFSTAAFNALVLKLNLPADVASQINVRIVHSVSSAVTPVYSNVLSLTVTPFNLTSWLYITGDFSGWANPGPAEDSLISVTGNGVYTGIINFPATLSQFLVLPAKKWDHKYATNDAKDHVSSTVAYDAPNNFYGPVVAGQTQVTININANTITFAKPARYYSVIGDATAGGWGTDTDMKYINDGSELWTINVPLVSTGHFKVRKNHDWTTSFGVPKTGGDGKTLASSDVNDIPVASSGTYAITFAPSADDATAQYTLVKQ
ncbi:MAG TPA: SusE domain-containing protein [Mucilaginibacter sp.]|nr:SusE domain-containing protein [Mucilaginibacter sp.]